MIRRFGLAVVLLAAPSAASNGQSQCEPIVLHRCKINYVNSSLIGMPTFGTLQESFVKRGDEVKAGQVLGHLPYQEDMAEAEMSLSLSKNNMPIAQAIIRQKMAQVKLRIASNLYDRKAYSAEQLNYDTAEEHASEITVAQAKYALEVSKLQHQKVLARIRDKQLIAPHDGIIGKVYKKQGEGCGVGEPVFRLDDVSTLQIIGKLDIRCLTVLHKGSLAIANVEIEGVDLPIEKQRMVGTITSIDTKIDPDTQTVDIIVEVENRDRLHLAGLEARLEIAVDKLAIDNH